MSRRVSLPAADDLFRKTAETADQEQAPAVKAVPDVDRKKPAKRAPGKPAARRSSGRVRHDEKMTVYVTSDELLDIEHARLTLRREHGLAVDRGRLVREALALVLADLETQGADSALVQRLLDE